MSLRNFSDGDASTRAMSSRSRSTLVSRSSLKNGKSLALDTPIPTPDGWTTMGDIQAGDTVFDEHGKPLRHQWARGLKAAVRALKLPGDTVVYTARHTVITDMLSDDGLESVAVERVVGTSAAMIKQNYYQIVQDKLVGRSFW